MHHPEKQMASMRQASSLTGRYKAPTWGPTQWGGEGTMAYAPLASEASSVCGV